MDALSWLAFWSLAVGLPIWVIVGGILLLTGYPKTYKDPSSYLLLILGASCGLAFFLFIACTKIVGIIYVWLWASKYLGA